MYTTTTLLPLPCVLPCALHAHPFHDTRSGPRRRVASRGLEAKCTYCTVRACTTIYWGCLAGPGSIVDGPRTRADAACLHTQNKCSMERRHGRAAAYWLDIWTLRGRRQRRRRRRPRRQRRQRRQRQPRRARTVQKRTWSCWQSLSPLDHRIVIRAGMSRTSGIHTPAL